MDIKATFEGDEEDLKRFRDKMGELFKSEAKKENIELKKFKGQIYKIDGTSKKR